jgi:hypothetical protein
MATQAFTEVPPKGVRLAESSQDHPAESGASPLAPTGTHARGAAGLYLSPDLLGPVTRDEHPSQLPEQSDLPEGETSFGWRRKLIAGTAIVAALGMCAFTYFLASAGEKRPTQTAEPAPAVQSPPAAPIPMQTAEAASAAQSSPAAPFQAASRMPEPSPAPLAAAAKPVEASPQFASAAPPGNTGARQTAPASQNRDVLFSQPAGVNIRSTPSANGSVLGIVPKGTRFEVTNRQGNWVEVESGRWKGWINARFLAPNEPG